MTATGTERGIGSRKRIRNRRTFWLVVAGFLAFAFLYVTIQSSRAPHAAIVVSEQTTRVTGPLDQNGNVAYLAALNQIAAEGVTSENNAAPLFLRAVGVLKPVERAEILKRFGVRPPDAEDHGLTEFVAFVSKKRGRDPVGKERDELEHAIEKPWSRRQLPLAAEWLASCEKPLELVIEGTRRPKCYFPTTEPDGSPVDSVSLNAQQGTRTAGRVLVARAMERLGDGDIAGAEQDLLACHRLGRLVGQSPFLIGALIAVAIDSLAFEGDVRLLEYGHLSAVDALAYQRELRTLPPLPDRTAAIDTSERFCFLDTVCRLAREEQGDAEHLPPVASSRRLIRFLTNSGIVDWNAVLAIGNEEYDKAVAASLLPTYPERKAAFEARERWLVAMKREVLSLGDAAKSVVNELSCGRDLSRQTAVLLLTFDAAGVGVDEAETHAETRGDLAQIGFALAAYRADHGSYPDRLDALVPNYISQVPKDRYSEKPLLFKRQGTGFLLYSVGLNGVDDGGKSFDSDPRGDDITIQMPVLSRREH
jgi:hypothetical protein